MFVAVNIGRNIGTRAMPPARWKMFQKQVWECLATDHKVVGHGTGVSTWGDKTEHFAVFHVVTGYGLSADTRDKLASLAKEYGQDAIGVMIESSLIQAEWD